MLYTNEQITKLHRVLVDMVAEIKRVCEENDISYFSHGGTTLGAVRHDGIIPWDDDVDIGMLRDDYEKFIKIAPSKLKEGYTLVHYSTNINAPQYYAKVKKDGTEFVEYHTADVDVHQGIFVDIFPFDFVPDGDEEFKKYGRQVKVLEQLYIAKSIKKVTNFHGEKNRFKYSIIRKTLHFFLIPIPKKTIIHQYEKVAMKYNRTKTNYVASRGGIKDKILLTDLFPLKQHCFESIYISVPNNTDRVLSNKYGNYMILPPEEKRVGHVPLRLSFESVSTKNS